MEIKFASNDLFSSMKRSTTIWHEMNLLQFQAQSKFYVILLQHIESKCSNKCEIILIDHQLSNQRQSKCIHHSFVHHFGSFDWPNRFFIESVVTALTPQFNSISSNIISHNICYFDEACERTLRHTESAYISSMWFKKISYKTFNSYYHCVKTVTFRVCSHTFRNSSTYS